MLRAQDLPDATVQAGLQDWVEMECFQIDAGPFRGRITQLGLGGMEICSETHDRTVHKRGRLPADRCTISASLKSSSALRFMEFETGNETPLFLLPAGTEFDVYVPGGMTTLYVALDQQALLAGARALAPAAWDREPEHLLPLGTAGTQIFIRTLRAVMDLCGRDPAADGAALRRNLMHKILLAMHAGAPPNPGDLPSLRTRRRKLHIVHAAQDYIRACLAAHATPSVVDICAHVGVSQRSLEYCFRDMLQITPVSYLRILRLNGTRRDLLNPPHAGVTVTGVAVRHGFLHLGKFARDYRRHFGEAPSETLFRALS